MYRGSGDESPLYTLYTHERRSAQVLARGVAEPRSERFLSFEKGGFPVLQHNNEVITPFSHHLRIFEIPYSIYIDLSHFFTGVRFTGVRFQIYGCQVSRIFDKNGMLFRKFRSQILQPGREYTPSRVINH